MFTFTALSTRTKRNIFRPEYLALLVLTLLLVPAAARAQVLYGSLVGNVTDPKGAAVSGAKVRPRDACACRTGLALQLNSASPICAPCAVRSCEI